MTAAHHEDPRPARIVSRQQTRTVVVAPVAKPKAKPVAKPVAKPKAVKPKPSKPKTYSTTPSWAAGEWDRFPASVEQFALCVAHHESWGTHNGRRLWTALNLGGSTASGFAQWIDSTWRANVRRVQGVAYTSRAYLASARDQAKVFAWMVMHGNRGAWHGTNCPGT